MRSGRWWHAAAFETCRSWSFFLIAHNNWFSLDLGLRSSKSRSLRLPVNLKLFLFVVESVVLFACLSFFRSLNAAPHLGDAEHARDGLEEIVEAEPAGVGVAHLLEVGIHPAGEGVIVLQVGWHGHAEQAAVPEHPPLGAVLGIREGRDLTGCLQNSAT